MFFSCIILFRCRIKVILASFTIFGRICTQLELLIASVIGRTHQGNLLGLEFSLSEFTNSVSLMITDYFNFLFLIESILENYIFLGNSKHLKKNNWYLECMPTLKWTLQEIKCLVNHQRNNSSHVYCMLQFIRALPIYYLIWRSRYGGGFGYFWWLCICKGMSNFHLAESGDSDQHPFAGHTRKCCGGLTAEFLTSLLEVTGH